MSLGCGTLNIRIKTNERNETKWEYCQSLLLTYWRAVTANLHLNTAKMLIIVRTNRTSQWMPFNKHNNNNYSSEENRKRKRCQINSRQSTKRVKKFRGSHVLLSFYYVMAIAECENTFEIHQSEASNCDQLIKLIASFVEISLFNADVSISDSFMRTNSSINSYKFHSKIKNRARLLIFSVTYCIFQRHHYIMGIVLQLVFYCWKALRFEIQFSNLNQPNM